MSRTKSALKMLAASADIQWSIADMLEAKAEEMEALKDWLMHTVRSKEFPNAGETIMQSAAFHDQLLEILAGVTNMERGLAKNMQVLLEEEDLRFGGDGFGVHSVHSQEG